MPDIQRRVDAHCHLFNIYLLTTEVGEILWDKLWGNYPHRPGMQVAYGAGAGVDIGAIISWVDHYIKLISDVSHAAFNNYEENYQLLNSAYKNSFKTNDDLIVYPLMMDIYYLHADAMQVGAVKGTMKGTRPGAKLTRIDNPETEFKKQFGRITQAILEQRDKVTKKDVKSIKAFGAPPQFDNVERTLNDIYQNITIGNTIKSYVDDGAELSKGFEQEVWELIKLQKAHPDTVFPFFAVDPRRRGVMDMVMKGKHFLNNGTPLVGKKGPFYGIKFYPRIGYLPDSIEKQYPDFFKWCVDNDIPITFHCSKGGFPPEAAYKDWPYDDFGNPDKWKNILKKYPTLRVDFAHFGGMDDGWVTTIISYMKQYPNVYADISCYVEDLVKKFKTRALQEPILLDRVMFGTDFNLNLITGFQPLQDYFDYFRKILDEGQFNKLYSDNPARFLNRQENLSLSTTGTINIVLPKIDWESRKDFVDMVTKENRFGWVRDLPDFRDYTMEQDKISPKHKEKKVDKSVKEMIQPRIHKVKSNIPSKVDLREWCSPVEDQGSIGSCTANAAVSLVEYFEIRTKKKRIDASRLFLYKVSRNLLDWQGDTGAYLRTAMEALVLFGVPPEQYMPYDIENFDAEPTPFCYAFAQNFQTASYYRLDPVGTKPEILLHNIKASLTAGYPMMFGFTVYDSMGEAKNNKGKIPFPSKIDRSAGGHAVSAMGFNDSIIIQNSDPGSIPTRGAILIRNSWGKEWGDGGYGWLPYEYVLKGLAVDWWSIIKQEWVDLDQFKS